MWFLFGEVSSSSWYLGWASYSVVTLPGLFHIIILPFDKEIGDSVSSITGRRHGVLFFEENSEIIFFRQNTPFDEFSSDLNVVIVNKKMKNH